jgi:anti-sigma regulatory factor (Ser/Thr protein kinase)
MDFNSEVRSGVISLHWQGEAVACNVAVARRLARIIWVDQGGTRERLADVALATTEAMGRAVEHAYPNGERGLVALDLSVGGGELVVEVRDFGATPVDASQDDLRMQIMDAASDRCTIVDASPGTRVTLAFSR